MDPLSSLRATLPQGVQPMGLPGAALVPTRIPTPELEQVPLAAPAPEVGRASGAAGFEDVLGRLVGEVNGRQNLASEKVHGLLSGQNVSLHETMIALEEASVSFQLMVEVRNKLLESYQEMMRMQV